MSPTHRFPFSPAPYDPIDSENATYITFAFIVALPSRRDLDGVLV